MAAEKITHIVFNKLKHLPVLIHELQYFARSDYEIHVIAPAYAQDLEFLSRNVPHIHLHLLPMLSRAMTARQHPFFKLVRYVEFTFRSLFAGLRLKAPVLVAHDLPVMICALLLRSVRRCALVYNAHELWSEASEDNAPLRPLWRRFERCAVRSSDVVIAPEPNRGKILLEEYGAKAVPVIVRNIPRTDGGYEPSEQLRERFSLSPDDVLVLYQGLLSDTRCLNELIAAFSHLPERYKLILIGTGEESYLQSLKNAAERSAPGRVHFLPWIPFDELRTATASADIGVLLYRNSGRNNYFAAPNKIYEYLHAGLALVVSDFPGLRAIVDAGGYGACSDPADSGSIARAIERAAGIERGRPIAEKARVQFRWDREAEILAALYARLFSEEDA
jgi:glycosyltransferase involved in cell wall biosynthesis